MPVEARARFSRFGPPEKRVDFGEHFNVILEFLGISNRRKRVSGGCLKMS